MAVKQVPVFLDTDLPDLNRGRFRVWAGAAVILIVCLTALTAVIQVRPTPVAQPANDKSSQPFAASPPIGSDTKLDGLKATFGRVDDKMKRVDSVIVKRVRWRTLADLGSVDGQPPLVPPIFLDPRFPGALKSLDSDAFFIYQVGEYKPGPYTYDWRIIVFDDATNTAMLEEGGMGLPPAYVGKLTPVSQVRPRLSSPPDPVPSPLPRPSSPSDLVPGSAPGSIVP